MKWAEFKQRQKAKRSKVERTQFESMALARAYDWHEASRGLIMPVGRNALCEWADPVIAGVWLANGVDNARHS